MRGNASYEEQRRWVNVATNQLIQETLPTYQHEKSVNTAGPQAPAESPFLEIMLFIAVTPPAYLAISQSDESICIPWQLTHRRRGHK